MNQTAVSEGTVSAIVAKVLSQLSADGGANASAGTASYDSASYFGRRYIGIYDNMEEALAAVKDSYKSIRAMTVEQRETIISEIRKLCFAEAEIMAKMGVEETGMGRVEHKLLKHQLVSRKTPGTEAF